MNVCSSRKLTFGAVSTKNGFVPLLAPGAGFGDRSRARLAKINERLKLGVWGRALNGDLWVFLG